MTSNKIFNLSSKTFKLVGHADLIIADPPYGVTSASWDQKLPPEDLNRIVDWSLSPTGAALIFAQHPFTLEVCKMKNFLPKYELIWAKSTSTGFFDAKTRPLRSHETIFVCSKSKLPNYYPEKAKGHPRKSVSRSATNSKLYSSHKKSSYDSTERFPRSVLDQFGGRVYKGIHPTQKPLKLIRWLIRNYSKLGDSILDPFSGSGVVTIAAMLEGRNSNAFEIDRDFYEKSLTWQKACRAHIEKGLDLDMMVESWPKIQKEAQ